MNPPNERFLIESQPADSFDEYIVSEHGVQTHAAYRRNTFNHSTKTITIVEQNGLVYPLPPKEDFKYDDKIVISEEWDFPGAIEADLIRLFRSEIRCSHSATLKKLREGYLNGDLKFHNFGCVRVTLLHVIEMHSLSVTQNLYHHPTNLLLSNSPPDEVMIHPQDTLGREELAMNYDTLTRSSNATGVRVELVSSNPTLKDGLWYVFGADIIANVKPSEDVLREQGLSIVWDLGDGDPPHRDFLPESDLLDVDKLDGPMNILIFGSLRKAKEYVHRNASRDLEHDEYIANLKREHQQLETEGKLRIERLKAENIKTERALELERAERQLLSERHDHEMQQLTREQKHEDREYKRAEYKQKSEELSLKSILTWATAVIGGVTLFNKLL